MTLFDNVKKLANNRGMSLQDVAKKSGMGANSIYKWKKDDYNPSKPAIIAVANTLGVTEKELKGEKNNIKKKHVNLEDDTNLLFYQGKPVSNEDKEKMLEIFKLMRGDK